MYPRSSFGSGFLMSALEEAHDNVSLNAGQDTSQLGTEVDLNNDFLNSDVIQNDVDALALEDRVNDLLSLMRNLNKEKAMSKSLALEAERIMPGFIKGSIDYYTDEPTLTMYNVSMEEMSRTVKTIIVAIAVAIIALIYKLVKWIFGGSSSSSGSGSSSGGVFSRLGNGSVKTTNELKAHLNNNDFKEAGKSIDQLIDNVRENVEIIETIQSSVDEFDTFIRGEEIYIYPNGVDKDLPKHQDGSLDYSKLTKIETLTQYVKYLTDPKTLPTVISRVKLKVVEDIASPTALTVDIIEDGELSKMITTIINQMSIFASELDVGSNRIVDLHDKLTDGASSTNERLGNDLVNHKELTKVEDHFINKHSFHVNGKEYKPGALTQLIHDKMNQLSNESTRKQHNFTTLLYKFSSTKNITVLENGLLHCKNMITICQTRILPVLESIRTEDLSLPGIAGTGNKMQPNSYEKFTKTASVLLQTLRDINSLANIIMSYIDKREKVMFTFFHVTDIIIHNLHKEAKRINPNPDRRMGMRITEAGVRLKYNSVKPSIKRRLPFEPEKFKN